MSEKGLLALLGVNMYLLLQSIEGFLRVGAALFAFVSAAFSAVLIIYKERHTIKKILGRVGEGKNKPPSN